MSNNPKLATEQQVKDVSDTFTEIINHQGKQIKALESGVIDAIEPSSPAPTKRGEYKVTKVGVYINFKDGNGQPISVTQEDFSTGNVSIIYNGTDCRKLIVPITFEGEVKEGDTRGVSGGEVYNSQGQIKDEIDKKIYAKITDRQNFKENTNSPLAFNTVNESKNAFGISIIEDKESHLKDILPYIRVFRSNSDETTSFRTYKIPFGNVKPNNISISFWTKRSQFEKIFSVYKIYNIYLGLFSLGSINGADYDSWINGGLYKKELTVDSPDYTYLNLESEIIDELGDWIRLNFNYKDIVWKANKTGIDYYFLFNQSNYKGNNLYMKDFTVLIDNNAFSNIVYPKSEDNLVSNIENISTVKASLTNQISDLTNRMFSGIKIEKKNDSINVITKYKNRYVSREFLNRQYSINNNPNINMTGDYFIDSIGTKTLAKTTGDDICPIVINNSYIGGNHGWSQAKIINSIKHGKTYADIGSIYTDVNGLEFCILQILDDNNIVIIVNKRDYSDNSPILPLSYLKNGSNTGSINGISKGYPNLYTCLERDNVYISADSEYLSLDKDYSINCNSVNIGESYYILDLPDIIRLLIENRPTNGYTSNVIFKELNPKRIGKVSVDYNITSKGNMVVSQSFIALASLSFSRFGFIQSQTLGGDTFLRIPHTKKQIIDGIEYNFNINQPFVTTPSKSIDFYKTEWEKEDLVPYRVITGNKDIIYHYGYILDRGKGENRQENINNALSISPSRKIYPYGDSKQREMSIGDSTSIISFRNIIEQTNKDYFTNTVDVDNSVSFFYADFFNKGTYTIGIDSKYIGKKIVVDFKENEILFSNNIVTPELIFIVDAINVTKSIVLKFI